MIAKRLPIAAAYLLLNQTPAFAEQNNLSIANIAIGASLGEVVSIIKKTKPDLPLFSKINYSSDYTGEELGVKYLLYSNESSAKYRDAKYGETIEVRFSFSQKAMYIRYHTSRRNFNKNEIIDAFSKKYNLPDAAFDEVGVDDISTRSQFMYSEINSAPTRVKNSACYNKKCDGYILNVSYNIQYDPMRNPNIVSGYEVEINDNLLKSQSLVDFEKAEEKINYKRKHPDIKYDKPSL